jgi:hypothetical protein
MQATSLPAPEDTGIVIRTLHRCHSNRSAAARITGLAALLLISAWSAVAQTPVTKQPQPRSNSQACVAAPDGRFCVEVRATPAEVRDFVRSNARELRWKIGSEMSSANTWTFTRYLEKEELAQTARTDALGGRVTWTEGKAFVQVKTSDAADGFTRVEISARFRGHGQTSERFARPTDLWPLASKGTLESGMIATLEDHFNAQTR